MEDAKKDNTVLQITIAATIVTVSAIVGVSIYNINDRALMAKNIEQAITKGVDPLSVKCSYQTQTDPICVTYSMKK